MKRFTLSVIMFLCSISTLFSQELSVSDMFSVKGKKEVVTIYSPGLEGNLLGDSPNRLATVYLPPGYECSPMNRYPVVYFLHGILGDHRTFFGGTNLQGLDFELILNTFYNTEDFPPLIIVTPNSNNKYEGSFYTNSFVTGQWEDFIIEDVVKYVEENYRTVPSRESRGLAGHSMGGYGTFKLSMKHPSLFSAAYAFSPYGLFLEDYVLGSSFIQYTIEAATATSFNSLSIEAMSDVMQAVAFAPDSTALPFPGQFPVTETGEVIDSVWERWIQHEPYAMLPQYKDSLMKLDALQYDCGMQDEFGFFPTCARFSDTLDAYGIDHVFEDYQGNHSNRLANRIETRLLPFFREHLDFPVPGIARRSASYLTSSDTLEVEMDRDGSVYIVPYQTPAVLDSIMAKQIKSFEVLAHSKVAFPITDMELGKYLIYGIPPSQSGISIPLPFAIDTKATPPLLTVMQDTVIVGDTLFAKSDKNGSIHIVITGTTPENFHQTTRIKASIDVNADSLATIPTSGLYPKDYLVYAVDQYGFFSDPVKLYVQSDISNAGNHHSATIRIFPNPFQDFLTLESKIPGSLPVTVYSVDGREILSTTTAGPSHLIDLSSLQKGIYFITIKSEDFMTTRKIIKL